MSSTATSGSVSRLRIGFREFVCLMAGLSACNALGVDAMLPALPTMGHDLGIAYANQQQWIVSAYLFGFCISQLICGPLADRFGRRPVTLTGLVLYAIMAAAAATATTMPAMLVARALQGMAAASSRVLASAMIRDCYSGRQMARVMSLMFILFLLVPMLAPSLGALLLLAGSWRLIFGVLAAFSLAIALWTTLRLDETLHPDNRRSLKPRDLSLAAGRVLSRRLSVGYALAAGMGTGVMFSFLASAQQLFADVFHAQDLFPILFACIASGLGAASFVNSRVVVRLGTRMVSHMALLGFILLSALHLVWSALWGDGLVVFMMLMVSAFFCNGLLGANFSAMAMEPMGDIAGTASSVQGALMTLVGGIIGVWAGQSFDGTTTPMLLTNLLSGLAALGFVLYAERWRLFRPHHASVSLPVNSPS